MTCSQLQRLEHIVPSDRVALSWSTNAPAVSEIYEMEAQRTEDRLGDARVCREHGSRVRLRLDSMIPVSGGVRSAPISRRSW